MAYYDDFFQNNPLKLPSVQEHYHWLRSLNLTCKAFNIECYRVLYHELTLDLIDEDTELWCTQLLHSIATRPHIAQHVRRFELELRFTSMDETIMFTKESVLKKVFAAMENLESLIFTDLRTPVPSDGLHRLGFQLGDLTRESNFQLLSVDTWYPRRMDLDLAHFLASQPQLVQLGLFLEAHPNERGEDGFQYELMHSLNFLPRLREIECSNIALPFLPYNRTHLESLYILISDYDGTTPPSLVNTTLTHLALKIEAISLLHLLSTYLPLFPNITSLQVTFPRQVVSHAPSSFPCDSELWF